MERTVSKSGKLILFCGKMGAGKTTLSKKIAAASDAVLISEDEWLASHYPDQIKTFDDYLSYSRQIKPFLKHHIQRILMAGATVALDFPANTAHQRAWLLNLATDAGSDHELNYLNVIDDVCLAQISRRRKENPDRSHFDTEQVFHEVTRYFEAPTPSEGLNIIERH